jgi:hypothetical protein
MRYQSRNEKCKSPFLARFTHATVLMIVLPLAGLSACATPEKATMKNVEALAGTWKGNGFVTDADFLFMTLVIHEDGTYELSGSVTSKGKIKREGNYVEIGPFDLWISDDRNGRRVLHGVGDDAEVAFTRRNSS